MPCGIQNSVCKRLTLFLFELGKNSKGKVWNLWPKIIEYTVIIINIFSLKPQWTYIWIQTLDKKTVCNTFYSIYLCLNYLLVFVGNNLMWLDCSLNITVGAKIKTRTQLYLKSNFYLIFAQFVEKSMCINFVAESIFKRVCKVIH